MTGVVVDTDILIEFLRGRRKAKEFLVSSLARSELHCSVITVAEISAGMRPGEIDATKALLDSLDVLDVTRDVAEKAGAYMRSVKSHGLELDDCLIAATAFVRRAVLATGNGKHYPMRDIEVMVLRFD